MQGNRQQNIVYKNAKLRKGQWLNDCLKSVHVIQSLMAQQGYYSKLNPKLKPEKKISVTWNKLKLKNIK